MFNVLLLALSAPPPFNWGGWILFLFLLLNLGGIIHVILAVHTFRREGKIFLDAGHKVLHVARDEMQVNAIMRETVKETVRQMLDETKKVKEAAQSVVVATSPDSAKIKVSPEERKESVP